MPDCALVFELGGVARDCPARHELPLPVRCSGAMLGCCWGESGSVLACVCEGEVLLYTWGLLGAHSSACMRRGPPPRNV